MTALADGVHAPDIELSSMEGVRFSLREALQRGPAIVAFFKVNCPVCQFTFPYLQRIFQAYGQASGGSGAFTLVGISQDSVPHTQAFNREFGVAFSTLLDEKGNYPVSNAYGVTNVPTIFVVSPAGEIESSIVGWSKPDMEQLNRKLAQLSGLAPSPMFAPGEKVPEYKPG